MNIAGTVLYVADIAKSKTFYSDLFALEPSYFGDDFALFELAGGQLRLWQQSAVEPVLSEVDKSSPKNSSELAFNIKGEEELKALFDRLATCSDILQPLCQMPFGKTFTIADPDGHRLRFMQVEVVVSN